jgi:SAM-dependent methyltransferase
LEANDLEDRIAEFPWWNYRFDFDNGVSTPVTAKSTINRTEQRRRYFFDALLGVAGGSLRGRRVLDLGCNAGMWSLQAIDAGADFVLGIDGLAMPIDQAKLVFETKGVDPARYRFEQADVFEHELAEQFDVVLCLDLMDQVAKPAELFEIIAGVGAEIVVIETAVSLASYSYFEVARLQDPMYAGEEQMVLLPTQEAVVDLAREFGFKTVPLARNMTDYTGMEDYRRGRRLAFVCSRGPALDRLAVEPQRRSRPSWVEMLLRGSQRLRG